MKANQKHWENKANEVLNFESFLKTVYRDPHGMSPSMDRDAQEDNESNANNNNNNNNEDDNNNNNNHENDDNDKNHIPNQDTENDKIVDDDKNKLAKRRGGEGGEGGGEKQGALQPPPYKKVKLLENSSDTMKKSKKIGGSGLEGEEETSKRLQYIDTDYPEPTDADDTPSMFNKQKRTVEYVSRQKLQSQEKIHDELLEKSENLPKQQQQQQLLSTQRIQSSSIAKYPSLLHSMPLAESKT